MKPFYQSKTFWFNILGGVIVILQYLGTIHIGDPKIVSGILAVVNLILRFFTDTGLTLN